MASKRTIADFIKPAAVLAGFPGHDYTLSGLLQSRLQQDAARPCILFNDKTWTWSEFVDAVGKTAGMLAARGIRHGDRVAVMAGNSDAHVRMLFALARLGAIMVPVNPDYGVEEARYVLNHAGVSAVACSDATLAVARAATAEMTPAPWFMRVLGEDASVPSLDALVAASNAVVPASAAQADDTVVIIYTSGTTGFPKGVMHSQRSFCLSGEREIERSYLQARNRALIVLPMFHINALFYSVAGTFVVGGCLVIAPRFSASQFWKLAADTQVTRANVMLAGMTILTRRPRSEYDDRHCLEIIVCGGLTDEIVDTCTQEFGIKKLVEGFGMTEVPGTFGVPVEAQQTRGSMGAPGIYPGNKMPWAQVRIVDDEGRDVADGVTGEMLVRMPTMLQGYYKDAEQTAAAIREGWFYTGDLVCRNEDGWYSFIARKKDIIRRRGENISGAELDRVIATHPAVSGVAVIAVSDDISGEEALAVVVRKPQQDVSAQDIAAWCGERLAAFKVPRYVVFTDDLPRTPTGKVAKHILKKDPTLVARAVAAR